MSIELPKPAKPWWKSRTLWANLITLLLLILDHAQQWDILKDHTALVTESIVILNIVLRFITKAPIKGMKSLIDSIRFKQDPR